MVQLPTAHHLASIVIYAESCLYSQWLPGDLNVVSDCLSRDVHLSDPDLSNLVQTCVPNQLPFGIFLSPLPTKISLWLTCLLQNQPFREEWSKEPMRSKLSLGNDSGSTYCQLESTMTGFSTLSHGGKGIKSLEDLHLPSEKDWQH